MSSVQNIKIIIKLIIKPTLIKIVTYPYHFLSGLADINSLNPHKTLLVEVTIIPVLQIRNVRLKEIG